MRVCLVRFWLAFAVIAAGMGWAAEVPLVIQVTQPTNQQFYASVPAQVLLEVWAIDPEGRIVLVEYFNGSQKIGESTNAPFAFLWENASPGTNVVRARAWDDGGVTNVSEAVTFGVNYPPAIHALQPPPGQTVALGSPVVLEAEIDDPDGTIMSVGFRLGGDAVAMLTNPPYRVVVSNLALGDALLTVVATDNWGAQSVAQVPFAVIVPDAGLREDFEPGLLAENWSEYGGILGVDLVATNFGGSVSGANALWFNADDDRYLVTRPMSLRAGAAVRFSLRLAGGEASNWNAPTLPEEGIVFDYSNNGGEWVILGRYNTQEFTNWQQVVVMLPPEALGTNTLLRWYQEQHSGTGFDHWAVDDIQVVACADRPAIAAQPQNASADLGADVVFSVVASGFPPLSYAWNVNGISYPASSRSSFICEGVTTNMSGWQVWVIVSNYAGTVTSEVATLTVRSDPLALALDGASLVWTLGGNAAWYAQTTTSHDGISAAQSGRITHSQESTLQTAVVGPGKLSYWWKVSSESGFDYLELYVDGVLQSGRISGTVDWQQRTVTLAAGAHAVKWRYAKDGSVNSGQDAGWVDGVSYTPDSPIPQIVTPLIPLYVAEGAAATFTMAASGAVPLRYLWYKGNPEPGGQFTKVSETASASMTLAAVSLADAGTYFCIVSNAYGAVTSAVAQLTVGYAPVFLTNPVSQIVRATSNLTLSAQASGTEPMSYQWVHDGFLEGITNNPRTIANVSWYDRGNYQLVATNLFGAATSKVAVIMVQSPPIMISQPQGVGVLSGMGAQLEVVVVGSEPFTYRWFQDGQSVPGALDSVLSLTTVEATNLGDYTVVITNAYGAVTSNPARIAIVAQLVDTFRILTLTTNHSRVFDHDSLTGDDRGGVAVSKNYVFYSGDNYTARFSLDDLSGGTRVSTVSYSPYDCLVSNLRKETVYGFANGTTLFVSGGSSRMDTLVELDGTTLQPVGRSIPLSRPITNSYSSLVCSGFNRVGYWDFSTRNYYDISLPSGTVTVYPAVNFSPYGSENWASWGVVEYYEGDLYAVYASGSYPTVIKRTRIRDGQSSTVASIGNASDLASFTLSLTHNRWYFHHEYTSQFTPSGSSYSETIGYADATFYFVDRTNEPPAIVRQPATSTNVAGTLASMTVEAAGSEPLSYQWRCNETNLPGATNAALTLGSMTPELEGAYSVVVTNAFGAVTSVTAMLYYDYGVVSKTVLLFGITNRWRYNQTGADLGTAWVQTNFVDTGWPEGRGILAYEDSNAYVIANTNTMLSLSGTNGTRTITYYFRTRFAFSNLVSLGARGYRLYSSNLVDDGAVFYLNGIEQNRLRVNSGITVTYQTQANGSATEGVYNILSLNASNLMANSASNLLAVEVHQYGTNSSDVAFGMALYAEYFFPSNPPRFTAPLADVAVNPGQMAVFSANVTGLSPMAYQWRFNGQIVPGQSGSTLAIFDTQVEQAGDYSVVVSNLVGMVTSRVARLTVRALPQIVDDPREQQLLPGATLSLFVTATGGDLAYRWAKDGQFLAWATNSYLTVSNVLPAVAGRYQVLVTNGMGMATSQPALVQIVGPRWQVPALTGGELQLRFQAEPGTVYTIDFSDDLSQWIPLQTVTNITGTIQFADALILQRPHRYYRLRLVP